MPLLLLCLTLLCTAGPAWAQEGRSRAGDVAPAADYGAALTAILARIVTDDGRVRYDLLRGPLRDDFRRVLKAVEEFDAAALRTDREKLAFWINAYNVQMLQHIAETPGVQDIIADGFADRFFRTPYRTARRALTLDEIEHVILRRQDGPAALSMLRAGRRDPRLHAGLNCAAVSCPRLRRAAFTAETVDAALDAAMRAFVNDPHLFRVEGETVVLSALLDWFGADFDAAGRPAGDFLLGYMDPARPGYRALRARLAGRTAAQLRALPGVRFEYRWAVNRAEP